MSRQHQDAIDALYRELIEGEDKGSGNGRPEGAAFRAAFRTDEEILAKCRNYKNSAKFSDLYDRGDVDTYHDGDDSRADLGLLGMLAFWTQDPAQLDRIFSGSALGQRDKWRSRHDYRQRTISKTLERLDETYSWPEDHHPKPQDEVRSRSHSLGSTGMGNVGNEALKQSIQALSFSGREKPGPREWVVHNIIWKGHASSWFGEGGVAKSLLALHLALTVAAKNRDYWMTFAVKTAKVLYIDFELDADEQHRRAYELARGMGLEDIPEDFFYLSVAMMPPEEAFQIAAAECRRLGIELVIVDSVGFALDGDSETARDVLGFYRKCIQPLKDAGASPLLIDHQAKVIKGEKYSDKQAFGSVYKTNAVRSSFQIRGSHEPGTITATFTHKKNNFGWKEKDFSLKVAFEEGRTTVERLAEAVPNPDREPSKRELVLKAVEDMKRATAETVHRQTGIELKTVQNAISDLLREGALKDTGEKQGRQRIVIPPSQSTKGTGTGTSEERPLSFGAQEGEKVSLTELEEREEQEDDTVEGSI